jgi:hypothetical protein
MKRGALALATIAAVYLVPAAAASPRSNGTLIEHHLQRTPIGGCSEYWGDLATGRSKAIDSLPCGRLNRVEFRSAAGGKMLRYDVIDFRARTWTTFTPNYRGKVETLADATRAIRDAIDSGRLRVIGHERVRGHDTIHLRASQSDNLWVNANTYLPVRERSPAVGEIDTDWLPRTAANLARFKLAVPAGFTHLVRQLPVSHR